MLLTATRMAQNSALPRASWFQISTCAGRSRSDCLCEERSMQQARMSHKCTSTCKRWISSKF